MIHAGVVAAALVSSLAVPPAAEQEPGRPELRVRLAAEGPGAGMPSLRLEEPKLDGGAEARGEPPKNYWVPALEMVGWNVVQNRWSYATGNREVYDVGWKVWKHNFTNWWWDSDSFSTNGFAHPYMGSLYFGMARSTGLSFWESAGYAFGGSLMWELFGETEPPSVNDQITTPWGGTIIGEILFRLSNRVLDGGGARPGFWRQLGATALDPAQGLNRILFGNRYRPPSDLNDQPFRLSVRGSVGVMSDAKENAVRRNPGLPLALDVHVVNGIPGGDWRFRRPFDHFDAHFSMTANRDAGRSSGFMTILLRSAVLAGHYGKGTSSGIWGLYFNYDYVAPAVYRVQSSNVGLGTTGQLDWGDWALQGHTLLGLGFGAGGSSAEDHGARDYHFGAQATVQLEGALFYKEALRIALRSREYLTGGKVTDQHQAWEYVDYLRMSVAWRLVDIHAVGVELLGTRRKAHYQARPDVDATVASLLVFYEISDGTLGRGR